MKKEHYDIIYETELDHWWYRGRRKIVIDILSQVRANRSGLKILDVGCGMGALMREMGSFGEVSGIDASPDAIAFCRDRGLENVVQGDAAQLPYEEGTFDVVVILDVLEHIKDDSRGAREVARVLKPGGLAIIAVPAFMFLWGVTDEVSHHYRRYTRKEVKSLIHATGLRVEKSSYFNTFLFPAIAFVRIAVRLLGIKVESENTLGGKLTNSILHAVFYVESFFLKYFSFPFGVSVLILATKE